MSRWALRSPPSTRMFASKTYNEISQVSILYLTESTVYVELQEMAVHTHLHGGAAVKVDVVDDVLDGPAEPLGLAHDGQRGERVHQAQRVAAQHVVDVDVAGVLAVGAAAAAGDRVQLVEREGTPANVRARASRDR
jgi:hypothetical protein